MKDVASYGIFRDDQAIAWLHQQRGGQNAVGLRSASPFEVKLPGRILCNHQIDLSSPPPTQRDWETFKSIFHDPLFKAMAPLPLPRTCAFYVEAKYLDQVGELSRMTSPVGAVVKPFWMFNDKQVLFTQLSQTNIQPLVLTNVSLLDMPLIREIASVAPTLPRQLILSSENEGMIVPHGVTKIATQMKANLALPWEQLGAEYVRRYMRGEFNVQREI